MGIGITERIKKDLKSWSYEYREENFPSAALLWAVNQETIDYTLMDNFLEKGGDFDLSSSFNKAIRKRDLKLIKYMLDNGANIKTPDWNIAKNMQDGDDIYKFLKEYTGQEFIKKAEGLKFKL